MRSWINYDGASHHMASSHDPVTNYRECSCVVRTAGGGIPPIEGVGNILLHFRSYSEAFDV